MLYLNLEPKRLNMFTATAVIDTTSWLELSLVPTKDNLTLSINTHHIDGEVDVYRAEGLYFIIRVLINNTKYNLALGRFNLSQVHEKVLEHILNYLYSADELKMLADEYECLYNNEIFYLDLADKLFSDEEDEELPY